MANQEQVERLKRSVDEWNQWRQEYPEICPDLSHANLSHGDSTYHPATIGEIGRRDPSYSFPFRRNHFSGANLSGADFHFSFSFVSGFAIKIDKILIHRLKCVIICLMLSIQNIDGI